MKATATKGIPGSAKGFTKYTGNVKSEGGALSKGTMPKKAGGKVKSSIGKKTVMKKMSKK